MIFHKISLLKFQKINFYQRQFKIYTLTQNTFNKDFHVSKIIFKNILLVTKEEFARLRKEEMMKLFETTIKTNIVKKINFPLNLISSYNS